MPPQQLQRLYLETSIFGFYDDPDERNRDKRESVRLLFDQISSGLFSAVCSVITTEELDAGPAAQTHIERIRKHHIEVVGLKLDDVRALADRYVADGIITTNHRLDAVHVACASILGVDVLVSLNLSHIVKTWRERRFNAVNTAMGYPTIRIATPDEVVYTP